MKDLEYNQDLSPLVGSPVVIKPTGKPFSEEEIATAMAEHNKRMKEIDKLCKEIDEFLSKQ